MLSIIISSYQENYFSALEKNIAETIGIPYEILKIDNPGKFGICEAYNLGASKSQYDYLLFVHEDVLFHTKNWGHLLVNHLSVENTGVVGVAGSNYVPKTPYAWFVFDEKYNFKNYIQNNKEKSNPELKLMLHSFAEVFALDGVFMAVKKSIFQEFIFDEEVKGFHGYDTDFSLRVATKYHNYVINNVLIEHFSFGYQDKVWLDNHMLIRKKIRNEFNSIYDKDLEIHMFYAFLGKYFQYNNFNVRNIKKTLEFYPPKTNLKNKLLLFNEYIHYLLKK